MLERISRRSGQPIVVDVVDRQEVEDNRPKECTNRSQAPVPQQGTRSLFKRNNSNNNSTSSPVEATAFNYKLMDEALLGIGQWITESGSSQHSADVLSEIPPWPTNHNPLFLASSDEHWLSTSDWLLRDQAHSIQRRLWESSNDNDSGQNQNSTERRTSPPAKIPGRRSTVMGHRNPKQVFAICLLHQSTCTKNQRAVGLGLRQGSPVARPRTR
ncbi:hypothetical protein BKA65DRAFT_479828 [Rhexocercosporidium sp. MPI-PUGE-AT-0058]|nr:hypothetical protein BKA65DRAFT_479828 [Rhexocercosporidium sp. MPI-PUGE-AT-0058]